MPSGVKLFGSGVAGFGLDGVGAGVETKTIGAPPDSDCEADPASVSGDFAGRRQADRLTTSNMRQAG